MKKFILGTAQLNLRYGIVNPKKKTRHQIYNFLEYCVKNEIYNFDTAEGYNNHKLLGDFFKDNRFSIKPRIFTKVNRLSKNNLSDSKKIILFKKKIENIIKDLNVIPNTIYFHDLNDNKFFHRNLYILKDILNDFGIINIGSSVYEIKDLYFLRKLKNITIQIPLSPANLEFINYKNKTYKIIARSIFLQGLLVNLNLKKLPIKLNKTYANYINYIKENQINPLQLCMNFINEQNLDNYIVGADDIYQLNKIIKYKKKRTNYSYINDISNIFKKKTRDPRLWQK